VATERSGDSLRASSDPGAGAVRRSNRASGHVGKSRFFLVTAPNGTEFQWSAKQERAAVLVSQDEQPDHATAKACRISKATLERWKAVPALAERIEQHRETWPSEIKAEGIGHRQNQINSLHDPRDRMQPAGSNA
jgi:hypothetical protein